MASKSSDLHIQVHTIDSKISTHVYSLPLTAELRQELINTLERIKIALNNAQGTMAWFHNPLVFYNVQHVAKVEFLMTDPSADIDAIQEHLVGLNIPRGS